MNEEPVKEETEEFEVVQEVSDSDFKMSDIPDTKKDQLPEEKQSTEMIVASMDDKLFMDDFHTARKNLTSIIRGGEDAFETLAIVARKLEHPAAFNALSTLIKELTVSNRALLELHDKKDEHDREKEYQDENKDSGASYTQNNTVFLGSTKELNDYFDGVVEEQ